MEGDRAGQAFHKPMLTGSAWLQLLCLYYRITFQNGPGALQGLKNTPDASPTKSFQQNDNATRFYLSINNTRMQFSNTLDHRIMTLRWSRTSEPPF